MRAPVKVKDQHDRFAKLKGIDVRVLQPAEKSGKRNGIKSLSTASDSASFKSSETSGKKGPERSVTGVKIEFKTGEERARFVETVRRVQERLLPLPDI